MTTIESVTLEVADPAAATDFYAAAFGPMPQVHLRPSAQPTTGFRGFTLSLLVSQPSTVKNLVGTALEAGAMQLKPAKRQFWGGYSGVVRAPDGTIWKVATSANRDAGPASRNVDSVALVLGVADMAVSKQFYVEHGLSVAKSFGGKYVEFDAPTTAIKLALYRRGGLAKDAGVAAAGTGAHRVAIGSDAGSLIDPDGFAWETASVLDQG